MIPPLLLVSLLQLHEASPSRPTPSPNTLTGTDAETPSALTSVLPRLRLRSIRSRRRHAAAGRLAGPAAGRGVAQDADTVATDGHRERGGDVTEVHGDLVA
jgi:hypothetical protein